jgi:Uma2 family endonuclease
MTAPARQLFDYRSYVLLEDGSAIRHEFLDGEVWAMAGGSPEHAAITMRVGRLLGNQLEGLPCQVYSSDLRIRVTETGLTTYPDVSVVCGSLELDPEDPRGHTVLNPTALIEVLSPSTEAYDRGEKLAHYKRIPSLREIVLVAQGERRVEVWSRSASGEWMRRECHGAERPTLEALRCELPLDDVYRDPLAG